MVEQSFVVETGMKTGEIVDFHAAMIKVAAYLSRLVLTSNRGVWFAEVFGTEVELAEQRLIHGGAGCHEKTALGAIEAVDVEGVDRFLHRAERLHQLLINPQGVVQSEGLQELAERMFERSADVAGVAGARSMPGLRSIENNHRATRTRQMKGGGEAGYSRSDNRHVGCARKAARRLGHGRSGSPPIGLQAALRGQYVLALHHGRPARSCFSQRNSSSMRAARRALPSRLVQS